MARKFKIGKINSNDLMIYKTGDYEEFKKINCFYCKNYDVYITPESCLTRNHKLEELDTKKYTACSKCSNNIDNEIFEVLKKRIRARRDDVSDEYLEKYREGIVGTLIESVYRLNKTKKYNAPPITKKKDDNIIKDEKTKKLLEEIVEYEDIEKEENKEDKEKNKKGDKKVETIIKNQFDVEVVDKMVDKKTEKISKKILMKQHCFYNETNKTYNIEIDKEHYEMLKELATEHYRDINMQIMYMIKNEYKKIFGDKNE